LTESSVRDAGLKNSLLVPRIGRYWISYRFSSDDQARKAWERSERETNHISAWRTRHPVEPPHTKFSVICLGETAERLMKAEEIFLSMGGTWDEPEDLGIIEALRNRREAQAVEAALAGKPGGKFQNRSKSGWTLSPDGKMHRR